MSKDEDGFLFKASHVALLMGAIALFGAISSVCYVKFQVDQTVKESDLQKSDLKEMRINHLAHEKWDAEKNQTQDLALMALNSKLDYAIKLLEEDRSHTKNAVKGGN